MLWKRLRNHITFGAMALSYPPRPEFQEKGKNKKVVRRGGPCIEQAKYIVERLLAATVIYKGFSAKVRVSFDIVAWTRNILRSRNEVFWGKVTMIRH